MNLVLEEARALLYALIRTIDRKADFSVTPHEGDLPGVLVNISLRKHKMNMVIPVRDLEAARQNSIQHAQLRTTIKRAIDRMMFETTPIASTKTVRGAMVDGGYFRIQQGNRGFRR
jgi:hypothetical protein